MWSPRCAVTLLCLIGLFSPGAIAQTASKEGPTASEVLKYRPTLPDVEYDSPADAAAERACTIENVLSDKKRSIGFAVRDGQGKMLRRFVIAHGRRMDQWSYYQDGFEVYREDDLDGDVRSDECRWLNAGGTRIALVERGKIKAWKQISAEEASKVLVQALVAGDLALAETVLATPAELAAAGLPKDIVDRVAAAIPKRAEAFDAIRKELAGWNKQTVWNRFDGGFPHVIPADPGSGVEKDLILYENAMVVPVMSPAQQAGTKLAFLQVPDIIQLGATWKFVELPRPIDPDKPIMAMASGLRGMLFDRAGGAEPRDEAMEAALKALSDYDTKNSHLLQSGDKAKIARFHVGRVQLLRDLAKVAKSADEQLSYNKQAVDSLIAAYRTGLYSQGRKPLEAIVADGGKLGSYAAYSLIDADFALKNDEPGANFLANQKKWMAELEDFLTKFAGSDEASTVLFHLANANEFNAEEDKAREQYGQLVSRYAGTEAGKKAAGALRRLDLTGKPLAISGTGLQNETIDSARYRGKPVLFVFWASWSGPVKQDLPDLKKVYDKYHGRGLEIVGINLDSDRAELDAFLKANPVAWPQICELGGMDSRLAVDYGIILMPTMFLVDAEGKVANRNLRTATQVERQLEKMLPAKQPGVALDQRD